MPRPTCHHRLFSDEHGAAANGLRELDISFDKFICTTNPNHEAIVILGLWQMLIYTVLTMRDCTVPVALPLYIWDEKELLENKCGPVHLKPSSLHCPSTKTDWKRFWRRTLILYNLLIVYMRFYIINF
ncbi:methionine--tRNA ligase [Salvia divinorum]|uniref:Methionine--tRNA ligase n=1 Tax=Salvia divinorum TaxID=28513 RepID=A0ABD1GMG4_SALDI